VGVAPYVGTGGTGDVYAPAEELPYDEVPAEAPYGDAPSEKSSEPALLELTRERPPLKVTVR